MVTFEVSNVHAIVFATIVLRHLYMYIGFTSTQFTIWLKVNYILSHLQTYLDFVPIWTLAMTLFQVHRPGSTHIHEVQSYRNQSFNKTCNENTKCAKSSRHISHLNNIMFDLVWHCKDKNQQIQVNKCSNNEKQLFTNIRIVIITFIGKSNKYL